MASTELLTVADLDRAAAECTDRVTIAVHRLIERAAPMMPGREGALLLSVAYRAASYTMDVPAAHRLESLREAFEALDLSWHGHDVAPRDLMLRTACNLVLAASRVRSQVRDSRDDLAKDYAAEADMQAASAAVLAEAAAVVAQAVAYQDHTMASTADVEG